MSFHNKSLGLTLALTVFLNVPKPCYAQNLTDILALALENNPGLREVHARKAATEEAKNQNIARLLPNLSATGASSKEYLNNEKLGTFRGSGEQDFYSNTFNLNLTQPIFHWEHWIQLSQSDNQIAQAEANFQAELQSLMVKITEAYFNILAAEDDLTFIQAEKEAIARELEQAQKRYEVGLIAVTDIYEAQAGFDQANANEIEAQNALDNQKEALREIIGDTEAVLDRLDDNIPLTQPEPADIETWSLSAEANNLNIIAAFNEAEAARKTIDLQRSGHLPKLDLVASLGLSDVSSSFGLRGDSQSIGLQLNLPIYEGGAVNSRTRQAVHEYEAAKQKLLSSKRSAIKQVKDAYRGVLSNISRVNALQSGVASAENALTATQAGLDVGTRTLIDVLNEQKNLFKTKRDLARSRYDYLINSIKLKQASSNLSELDISRINRLLKPNKTR
ncbi:MAG: channel protein TolC [Methylobacter sp.]|nr:MAG: channel protein TolC [Methylobacter sp.]PPD36517.1 MAG: channel protein TolC [Methylomonas sp.]